MKPDGDPGPGAPEQSTQKLDRYGEIAASIQPAELREIIVHFGPTFLKVGKFLGTRRGGLLPPRYIAGLSKLEDTAAPVPHALVVAVIESELGARLEKIFAPFDRLPLATTSIGQVHATPTGGEEVVVKVQRPLLATEIEFDLVLLRELAREAEDLTSFGSGHDLNGLLDELAYALRRELDYVLEGQNIERQADDLAKDAGIRLPRIHWNYATKRVIEQVRGLEGPAWPRWLRRVALGRAGGRRWPRSLPEAASVLMWPQFGLLRSELL